MLNCHPQRSDGGRHALPWPYTSTGQGCGTGSGALLHQAAILMPQVMHIVYLLGMFFFAVLVGVVTEDINSAMDEVKQGSFAVVEQQHTVVLGWNKQIKPMLQQVGAQLPRDQNALGLTRCVASTCGWRACRLCAVGRSACRKCSLRLQAAAASTHSSVPARGVAD